MGVPMLQKKRDLNYRRGLTWKHCATCRRFRFEFGPDGNMLQYGKCPVIGTGEGRAYRVLPHYLCDAHEQRKASWEKA